jgi:Leucine-rich repeat (LRR) protein
MKIFRGIIMPRIFLIAVFVGLFVGCSTGQKCGNFGWSDTSIVIHDCDRESMDEFSRSFGVERVVRFNAGWNNNFSTIDASFFKDMRNLTELRLTACKVESVASDAFSELKSLSSLGLIENQIKILNDQLFHNLENLQELQLWKNQIEEIPAKLFENNRKLKILWLSENKIKAIPLGLLDFLTELEEFAIDDNQLEVIHPNTFQQNKKLKQLFLDTNKIGAIAVTTFDGLTKLTCLTLVQNSCIDREYGNCRSETGETINLESVASDLTVCASNYDKNLKVASNNTQR